MRQSDIEKKQKTLNEKLFKAVLDGNINNCRASIRDGADINFGEEKNPFAIAVGTNNTEICDLLLKNGANIHLRVWNKLTPILMISYNDHNCIKTLNLLIANGANVNDTDDAGWNALFWACFHGNVEAATILLKNGADWSIVDKNNWNIFCAISCAELFIARIELSILIGEKSVKKLKK